MFFLWLIIIIFLITLLFTTLSIKLEFENFIISFPKISEDKKNDNGKVKLKIYIFKKIKIADINLKNVKKEKIKFEQIKKILNSIKDKKNTGELRVKDIVKGFKIKVEKINLDIEIGIKDAATTAILVGLLYTIIENLIVRGQKNIHNQKCLITPNYKKEIILIKLDSIFELNMWNIINTFLFQTKRRVKENGTSNRRINVFSNE